MMTKKFKPPSIDAFPVYNWLLIRFLICLICLCAPALSAGQSAPTIHQAALQGDLEAIQRLVVSGADVNSVDSHNETPLTTAALAGHGEVVNYLLQRGARISAVNANGLTPLHAAAYGGHTVVVELLLAKGAAVNQNQNRFGVAPLHLAAEENQIDVAVLLLAAGADPRSTERHGYTALSRAGWRSHWEVVNLLLDRGATCQGAELVGEWLYDECSKLASAN